MPKKYKLNLKQKTTFFLWLVKFCYSLSFSLSARLPTLTGAGTATAAGESVPGTMDGGTLELSAVQDIIPPSTAGDATTADQEPSVNIGVQVIAIAACQELINPLTGNLTATCARLGSINPAREGDTATHVRAAIIQKPPEPVVANSVLLAPIARIDLKLLSSAQLGLSHLQDKLLARLVPRNLL